MLGIYIHWPFCRRKCSYCAFVSSADTSRQDQYARALLKEIRLAGEAFDYTADTAFFGGGTPSLCPPDTVERILRELRRQFGLAEGSEITMEANPGTLRPGLLRRLRDAGVNRLSLGLQATKEEHLRLLGRIHTFEDGSAAMRQARQAGFDNISLDLLYGFPGQTMEDWRETLGRVLAFESEHISLYCLSLEEGTPLWRLVRDGLKPEPDDDLAADMYVEARRKLLAAGYRNYEISNFARPGRECRHNLKYWTREDYLGFGVAAHSLTQNLRFAHGPSVEDYISLLEREELAYDLRETLDAAEREREFLMLRSRLAEGFALEERERLFGAGPIDGVLRAEREGLVRFEEGRVAPTEKGFLFQNRLALMLMEDVNDL